MLTKQSTNKLDKQASKPASQQACNQTNKTPQTVFSTYLYETAIFPVEMQKVVRLEQLIRELGKVHPVRAG